MKNKTILSIIIIFLVFIGLVLLGAILSEKKQDAGRATSPQISPEESEKSAILTPPASDASGEEKEQYMAAIESLSAQAPYLDITQCIPTPLVFQMQKGNIFKVQNQGESERVFALDADHIYKVPAGGSIDIEADITQIEGVYGYACDLNREPTRPTGLISVVE